MHYHLDDTIAALATTPGESGLCVIRMSGPQAFSIADRVFNGRSSPSQCSSHTVHYGHIQDPSNGEIIDEVLLTIMRAPRTFTCQDVAEISGHGGYRPGIRILETLTKNGARIAQPGEFTRRAFLNGRLDLLQAEAVADIIRSRTDASMKAALRQLHGRFSKRIETFRSRLVNLLSLIEVGLDFTEEDIPDISRHTLKHMTQEINVDLNIFLEECARSRIIRDGARIAIIGRPNVGKSSLLNQLLGRDRAIIDSRPGTTRDTLEEMIDLQGVPVIFIDTAGWRTPDDSIEAQGIKRTEHEIDTADLILLIIDGSSPLFSEDHHIARICNHHCFIPVINKSDLPGHADVASLPNAQEWSWVQISALTGIGIQALVERIKLEILGESGSTNFDMLINTRHHELLTYTADRLSHIFHMIDRDIGQEVIAVELREAIQSMGQIIGKDIGDDVLSSIFSSFCIGK